jgi:hypothetical protein
LEKLLKGCSELIVAILPRLQRAFFRPKKWPPACAEGLPWSDYTFRLLQRGAGERIPVAVFKLWQMRIVVKVNPRWPFDLQACQLASFFQPTSRSP